MKKKLLIAAAVLLTGPVTVFADASLPCKTAIDKVRRAGAVHAMSQQRAIVALANSDKDQQEHEEFMSGLYWIDVTQAMDEAAKICK